MARPNPGVTPRRPRLRTQRHRDEEVDEDGHVERVPGDPSKGAVGLNAHHVRLHQNGDSKDF